MHLNHSILKGSSRRILFNDWQIENALLSMVVCNACRLSLLIIRFGCKFKNSPLNNSDFKQIFANLDNIIFGQYLTILAIVQWVAVMYLKIFTQVFFYSVKRYLILIFVFNWKLFF